MLSGSEGETVDDGMYTMHFNLYGESDPSTSLWSEIQNVTIVNGIFNVILGAVNPLELPFDEQYYLGITIDDGTELSPRIALTSSAYSFRARSIDDGQVVKSINELKDDIVLEAGENVSIAEDENKIIISATAGGGSGNITQITAGDGLTGGGTEGEVTLAVDEEGITSSMLASSAVTTSKIINNAVTSEKIASGAVTSEKLANNSVITAKIADETVTQEKIHPDVSLPISGNAGGDLTGTYPNPEIAENAVTSDKIANGQVVRSINSLNDDVILEAGDNVSISSNDNKIIISSDGTVETLTLPYAGTASMPAMDPAFSITNTNASGGVAIKAESGNFGMVLSASHVGLHIPATGGTGIMIDLAGGQSTYGGHGLWVRDAKFDGVRVDKAGRYGLYATGTQRAGFFEGTLEVNGTIQSTGGLDVEGGTDDRAILSGSGTVISVTTTGDNSRAISASATGNSAPTGVYGTSSSATGRGVFGEATSTTGSSVGVQGETGSTDSGANGVFGLASNSTAAGTGVKGQNNGTNGYAVWGQGGNGATGVLGQTNSSTRFGVWAYNSGTGVALRAEGSGNLIEAWALSPVNVRFRVDNNGNVTADGTFTSPAADFAELLPAAPGLEPGDVLVIQAEGTLGLSDRAYQPTVVGVYSTEPAFLGGAGIDADRTGKVPLAVVGIVPVKASAENGVIRPGDMLTPSDTPGHAMRAGADAPVGTVIGKALTNLESGTGVIRMLVTLQ